MFWILTTAALATTPVTTATPSTELAAPATPREGVRLGLTGSAVPAGMGVRAHIPVGDSGTVYTGASVGLALFSFDTMPVRLRAELGARYYLGERYDSFFVGPYSALSIWTEQPVLGGSNFAAGPMIGMAEQLRNTNATVVTSGGALLHAYIGDNGVQGGDGLQVLPQLEVSLIL